MNRTERYLKRATLGLWGRRRREAQMELRGILEDKLWRFQFLGLSAAEAETRALAELGPASTVARGLSRVHSVPVGVQGMLLACVLGVQTVGAISGVRATMQLPAYGKCNFDEAFVKALPVKDQKGARAYLTQMGRANAEATCREIAPGLLGYLSIDDLFSALKTAGVSIKPKGVGKNQHIYSLKFPGEIFSIDIDLGKFKSAVINQGGDYVDASWLISSFKENFSFPLKVSGVENPILQISTISIQLGTLKTPVRAANILTPVMIDQLLIDKPEQFKIDISENGEPTSRYYASIVNTTESGTQRGVSLKVNAPDDSFYAVLLNKNQDDLKSPKTDGSDFYQLAVRPVQSGHLWLGRGLMPTRLVSSFADLQKARTSKQQMALLLKITSSGDLRHVTYQIVPPTEAQLVPVTP